MKTCKQCLATKSLSEFSKHPKTKDKLQPKCKSCESENNKIARQKNPTSKYYQQNKQYYKEYSKQWITDNEDRWKEYYKEWQKEYQRNKYKADPLYKLRMCVGSRIRQTLKSQNKNKLGKITEYIGCRYEQLKHHIESQFTNGMSWDN